MGYGINNVVGGFGRALSPEEALPYALNRTYHEHKQLRNILGWVIKNCGQLGECAVELGCGYGRNLPILLECFSNVWGIERDEELFEVARALNPTTFVRNSPVEGYKDIVFPYTASLVMSFTFLQHLNNEEVITACNYLRSITAKGSIVIICEETDPAKSHVGCWSRSPEVYQGLLGDFSILLAQDRVLEATFPGRVSGKFVVLRRNA